MKISGAAAHITHLTHPVYSPVSHACCASNASVREFPAQNPPGEVHQRRADWSNGPRADDKRIHSPHADRISIAITPSLPYRKEGASGLFRRHDNSNARIRSAAADGLERDVRSRVRLGLGSADNGQ